MNVAVCPWESEIVAGLTVRMGGVAAGAAAIGVDEFAGMSVIVAFAVLDGSTVLVPVSRTVTCELM